MDTAVSPRDTDPSVVSLPASLRTPTFTGFVATQFLGAFNDNYFKQLVLLTCVNETARTGQDRQPLALAAFALPFVLLSGFGGYLSDRFSKQRTIIFCKVAEIAIMAAALGVLLLSGLNSSVQLMLLIGVLAFMGAQSAIFGPSKYGALPELFRPDQLLLVNGVVQMTTFLAIIFGVVFAGIALDYLGRSLWTGSLIAVGIAIAGTLTSLLIRPTAAANPRLPLQLQNLAVPVAVRVLLRQHPGLFQAMLVATVFWFVGGVAQPAVNTLGRMSLGLSETRASLLTAAIGIGIAAGCALAGSLSASNSGRWMMRGAWGMILALFSISLLGSRGAHEQLPNTSQDTASLLQERVLSQEVAAPGTPAATSAPGTPAATSAPGSPAYPVNAQPSPTPAGTVPEPLWQAITSAGALEWMLRLAMTLLGICAGIFVVPIQVYLQQTPPPEQKGRVLGVQNLLSWIGILLSAVFLEIFNRALAGLLPADRHASQQHLIFTLLAVMLLPVAACYRLPKGLSAESDSP